MGSIARMDPKLPSKCWDVSWPSSPTPNSKSFFSKVIGLNQPPLKIFQYISKLNFVAHGVKFSVLELICIYDIGT